ncbi:ATP-dependent zinc metalloprotease FtsH [Paraburkholderia tuberum]|uniref:ATP-dependent zinc metalloprotease FtsH n=1 Tax=Paraburkholderia tuberum TaxID=157910 RepID=A0A1H1J8P9_9BURK|nr:ATP-dependent zinc metalloprotease FtsH [Paraburkholderia tuberum]SDR46349.1 membrane protease FtsH catalytic subunit [Paraburkholderia tuberum]
MDKQTHFNIGYTIAAVIAILLFQSWWVVRQQVETIPFSQFEQLLKDGKIEAVNVRGNLLDGKLSKPLADGRQLYSTVLVRPDVYALLDKYNVKVTGVVENHLVSDILSWVLPAVFFVGIWMFAARRLAEQGGMSGLMTIGKSKARIFVEKDTKVTFEDVAGVDEAKDELIEIVNFLKMPQHHGRLGARIPKGVLLVGPPGTGKTLLARAVAGEAGVPFFSISGSEFVEMFVGVGAARVRDLFEQARKVAPCIIFIDELDALGRARGIGSLGGHDEKEQTLNQLLMELDGFDPQTGIVLLAATNRPEVLDPALLRAGRFDRQVLVDRPDKAGRIAILKIYLKGIRAGKDIDPEQIAALTPGFSGADLANLVNEAALQATKRDAQTVDITDFTVAIERIVAGLERKSRLLIPKEREIVAFHEMGHALVALVTPGADPVQKISIVPHGIGALGYTMQRPTDDRFLMSRAELRGKMAVLLGGRSAEALVFDEISSGAADDLAKATHIARMMVTRFGMSEDLGQMTYESQPNAFLGDPASVTREYSEETAREIDCAVRALVRDAANAAMEILRTHRKQLDEGAKLLLEKETLLPDELPRIG